MGWKTQCMRRVLVNFRNKKETLYVLRSGEKVYSLGKKITGSCFAKSSKMEKKLKMTQQTNTLFDRWIYGVSFLKYDFTNKKY